MDIRHATEADVPDIQAIYAHHVLYGTGTFEEDPPSVEEMLVRFHKVVDRGCVWLVATDATGVLGFGYYAPFRDRSATVRRTVSPSRTAYMCARTCAARVLGRPWCRG
jgi:L-amino acid N-acyltransferase YncA